MAQLWKDLEPVLEVKLMVWKEGLVILWLLWKKNKKQLQIKQRKRLLTRKTKEFKFLVEELLSKEVKVEAENEEQAVEIIKKKYRNQDIVLDSGDFAHETIKIYKE